LADLEAPSFERPANTGTNPQPILGEINPTSGFTGAIQI